MADDLQKYKYIIKNTAVQNGYTVTFMPKPLFHGQRVGNARATSRSGRGGQFPSSADENGYAGQLSEMAIALHRRHPQACAFALLAFCAPTTNSYRRLVPGYEAPINLIYSARNRSACVRIPVAQKSPKSKRIEFRAPDPAANPYLAFAAMLMAGLDGIENKIQPPAPIDKDLYEMAPAEKKEIQQTPGSLLESLTALENDHEYLLKGGVFSEDLITTYLEYKRTAEHDQIALRPHPYEFALYYDI